MQSILVRPYILDSLTRYEDERIQREADEKERLRAERDGTFQSAIRTNAKKTKYN